MVRSRIILLLIFSLLFIQEVRSQTADEIIKNHIDAIGGYEKIKAIKSIIFEGSNKSSRLETSFKSYIIHDSAACTEGIANGKPSKGIVTKKGGWVVTQESSKNSIHKKSKYEIKQDQRALDIHGPLVDFREKRNKIKYLGKEKINDIECFKLKLIKPIKAHSYTILIVPILLQELFGYGQAATSPNLRTIIPIILLLTGTVLL